MTVTVTVRAVSMEDSRVQSFSKPPVHSSSVPYIQLTWTVHSTSFLAKTAKPCHFVYFLCYCPESYYPIPRSTVSHGQPSLLGRSPVGQQSNKAWFIYSLLYSNGRTCLY